MKKELRMNVPIRMLGIAATIFWIILAAFIALAAYSIKDLNFDFGEPQFTLASNNDLRLSMPFYIDNRGLYSLKAFNLTTVFSDPEGDEVSHASTFVPVLPRGQNTTIIHNVTLTLASLWEEGGRFLFNDTDLSVAATAGLTFAELMPVQLSTNFSYPWGAPFYDFALGQAQQARLNATHARMRVPVSFENHAAFDLAGTIETKLYNDASALLGESQTDFAASEGSEYAGTLEFAVPLNAASSLSQNGGHFEVYFSTSMFEYGPVVIPLG